MKQTAFTLAELLIALALMALIATFSIPKIVQATNAQAERAKFQETMSALSRVTYTMFLEQIHANQLIESYRDKLNPVRYCLSSVVEGCAPPSSNDADWDFSHAGFVLQNGVMVGDIDENAFNAKDEIFLDLNGTKGPNLIGNDQFRIAISWHRPGTFYRGAKAGTVACSTEQSAAILAQCQAMFD